MAIILAIRVNRINDCIFITILLLDLSFLPLTRLCQVKCGGFVEGFRLVILINTFILIICIVVGLQCVFS